MSAKILVADDSQTIQKVVSMTLAGEDFDLIECRDASSLDGLLKKSSFDLILLDYNLSSQSSGAEVLGSIRKIHPDIPIVLMVGIFDSINEADLNEFSIAEKLVKPFNNQRLIQICRDLTEGHVLESSSQEMDIGETSEETTSSEEVSNEDEDFSGWEVESSSQANEGAPSFEQDEVWEEEVETHDDLTRELAGWGMEVPQVIGESKPSLGLVPPVIERQSEPVSQEEAELTFELDEEEEAAIPAQEDLSYPDMDSPTVDEIAAPKSKLISLDELAEDPAPMESMDGEDDTDPGYALGQEKSQLEQEIEAEISPEDFWAAEESDEGEKPQPVTMSGAVNQAEIASEEPSPRPTATPSQEELLEMMKAELAPKIEEWARQYCKETIERVAWEVIPDLAENLIQREIKSISESFKQ